MPSAAKIAKDLSTHSSANRESGAVSSEPEEMGGIVDEGAVAVDDRPAKTGTPFDKIPGRPNVDFWGPFEVYSFVTTPHGEFAVPQGRILRFEYRNEWDPKEGMNVVRAYPKYEDAPAELIAYVAG